MGTRRHAVTARKEEISGSLYPDPFGQRINPRTQPIRTRDREDQDPNHDVTDYSEQ